MGMTKKLEQVFYGVDIAHVWPDELELARYHHFSRPPSYLVQLALTQLYGERLPRGGDKSDWAIPLSFSHATWLVSDWKRYACDIYGPEGAEASADDLLKKLKTAAHIAGTQVMEAAKQHRDRDEISLYNEFPRLNALYKFFRSEAENVQEQLSQQPPANKVESTSDEAKANIHDLVAKLNDWFMRQGSLEKRLHANTVAAIVAFFSTTEAVLDAAFALGDRKVLSFAEYRRLSWAERLRMWIDGNQGDTAEVYEALIEVRKEYRNTATHSSPVFFFSLPGIGLVPIDYKELYLPQVTPWPLREAKEAQRIFDTFDATVCLFNSNDLLKFAYKYAESGLSIHINNVLSDDLKRYMTSLKGFEDELMYRCEMQDLYNNMDI
jgi:hypothetical protein